MSFARPVIRLSLAVFAMVALTPLFGQVGGASFSGQRQWIVVKSSLHDFTFTGDLNIADFDDRRAAETYAYELNRASPPSDVGKYVYLTHQRGRWGTSNNPTARGASAEILSPSPDQRAADLDNRLKLLRISTADTFKSVLDKGGDVAKRIDKLSKYLGDTVPTLTTDAFKEMNGLIGQFNAMAKDLGVSDRGGLNQLPPLDAKLSPKLQKATAVEQLQNIKVELDKSELRLEKRNMDQAKEEIEIVVQQIAADKAGGIDVSQRERRLNQALDTFAGMKSRYQTDIDTYMRDDMRYRALIRSREKEQLAERQMQQPQQPAQVQKHSSNLGGTRWSQGNNTQVLFNNDGTVIFKGALAGRGTWSEVNGTLLERVFKWVFSVLGGVTSG